MTDLYTPPHDMHAFYSKSSIYSNHYLRDMVIDGVRYNCIEQWMMAEKARRFDPDKLTLIMAEANPSKQKYWGRAVQNYNEAVWVAARQHVVLKGLFAKFTQHKDLYDQLLGSGQMLLVEASPTDCIWGVGLAADNPDIHDPRKWRGENLLGQLLMSLRTSLRDRME